MEQFMRKLVDSMISSLNSLATKMEKKIKELEEQKRNR